MRRERVELVDVELAELLNVYRPPVLVGAVVELRVVLVDLGLLGVVEAVPGVSIDSRGLSCVPSRAAPAASGL